MTTVMPSLDGPLAPTNRVDTARAYESVDEACAEFSAMVDDALETLTGEPHGSEAVGDPAPRSLGAAPPIPDDELDDEHDAETSSAALSAVVLAPSATRVPTPNGSGPVVQATTDRVDAPGITVADAAADAAASSDDPGEAVSAPADPTDSATAAPSIVATEPPVPSVAGAPTDQAPHGLRDRTEESTLDDSDALAYASNALRLEGADLPAPVRADAADTADLPTSPIAPGPLGDDITHPASPWTQLARAVHEVQRDENGTHSITVRLDPPELGTVEIEVRVRDGQLSLHAATDSAATRDLLQRSMPELRASLQADGIATGSLDVGARSAGQDVAGSSSHRDGGHDRGSPTPARGGADGIDAASADGAGSRVGAGSSTRLDLRL